MTKTTKSTKILFGIIKMPTTTILNITTISKIIMKTTIRITKIITIQNLQKCEQ